MAFSADIVISLPGTEMELQPQTLSFVGTSLLALAVIFARNADFGTSHPLTISRRTSRNLERYVQFFATKKVRTDSVV
jgi:hypothetical protein